MSVAGSANEVSASLPENFENQNLQGGQNTNVDLSADAWSPRNEGGHCRKVYPTVDTSFLPFSRLSSTEASPFDPQSLPGLVGSWNERVVCSKGPGQYQGANADAPQPYASKEQVAGNQLTKFYQSNEPTIQGPERHRYLNQPELTRTAYNPSADDAAEQTLHVPQLDFGSEVTTVSTTDRINQRENFESNLNGPIEWRKDSMKAFVEALETQKPMVVIFGDDSSEHFKQQLRELNEDRHHLMGSLSDRAVWVVGKPTEDEYARRMATHLKLTDYPTISVIAPRTDKLTETYRMEGYFPISDIYSDLKQVLPPASTPAPLVQDQQRVA